VIGKKTLVGGVVFVILLVLNYLYMFSGIFFAFYIMKDHPIWSAIIIAGALAFFKGLAGLGKRLKKLDLVEKNVWADDKVGITFLNNQRKKDEEELGLNINKSYVQNLIDEANKNEEHEVNKNGMVAKSEIGKGKGSKGGS